MREACAPGALAKELATPRTGPNREETVTRQTNPSFRHASIELSTG